ALAAVVTAKQPAARDIDPRRGERTDQIRHIPIPADARLVATNIRLDARRRSSALVEPRDGAILTGAVNDVGIFRVDAGLHPIAAAAGDPTAGAEAGWSQRARWSALRAVILRAAIDVVKRHRIIHRHAIRLQAGQIREIPPARAAIVGLIEPAVV